MTELKRTSLIRRAMSAGQGRIVFAGALLAALFAGVGVFHVSSHVSVVRAGYELDQVQRRYNELLRENEHLKMERATLRSAPRLESIARARLGLLPPTPGQVVVFKPGAALSRGPVATRTVGNKAVASVARAQPPGNP
ncbi:MAG: cell division protein FtsL [Deltaproteobacteria bacterium]|nr:cell division protein FtsL [Deltaproteobacteria bacterium]